MAKVEDCPGFETFGADVKAAREAKRLARKTLAEMVGIEWRYLANIENQGAIPSLPVMIQLIRIPADYRRCHRRGAQNGTDCEAEGGRIIAASFWRFYIKFPGTFPKVPGTSAGFLRFLSQSDRGHFR